ncbi:MAG: RluA family pseudouridine synthase [Solobacterium sp.]|jgi:23S rRNA pseudouridine1911/1915/1917 synthase|nr:RluA family pseudouridine synthase [Solobacterium sp.]MCH4222656.1 RluA family pseudouridine synthase [Solobacterium sp.]MCH4265144.1 RluA family pseudouridine synthase [Solobacterium sp.]
MKTVKKAKNFYKKKTEKKEEPIRYTAQYKIGRSTELLEFLLQKQGRDMSRNSIKSLLSQHKVLVNGKVVSQFDYPLAKDDEVKIAKNSVHSAPVKKLSKGRSSSPIASRIIYEDSDFIAVNKPNGLLSVESDTDRNSAYAQVGDYLKNKDAKARPYVLHRIDKETSGVLVFAKDIKIHSMLRMHWNEDVKLREYTAVIEGKLKEKTGTIISYLKENENNMVYVSDDPHGKKAVTHYEVLQETDQYSLLRVTIDTGRKNQIRVQFANEGHPVVGDDKYGNGQGRLHRLGLHASRLDFIHPVTKQMITIKAPVPQEFTQLFSEAAKQKKRSS